MSYSEVGGNLGATCVWDRWSGRMQGFGPGFAPVSPIAGEDLSQTQLPVGEESIAIRSCWI